jgi:hypothetical protein
MGVRGFFIVIAAQALLAGCAQQVQTTVQVFHMLPPQSGKTIAFIPVGEEATTGLLEWNTYASELAPKFQAAGYTPIRASEDNKPDYVAVLVYGIDDGKLVTSTYSIPQFGVTGYSGSVTTGTVTTFGNTANLNATTTNTPTYGVTGYSTETATSKIFTRAVILTIYDASKLKQGDASSIQTSQVYQAKLTSAGSCGALAGVMEPMLEAIFKDFPGKSGSAQTVNVRMDRRNAC